ncbi:MAG: ParB/RepB/Spo0J family partition protein [Candidatus Nitrosocaldus sp.]|nr:ParB/RepB/Spo0J family partition protein [Candidatus Nitrosocaldus sp.]MDW8275886.1 ParB/RepB/Spo0J family partition protein [Candidatus Nitrosocaldus sp.]
MYRELENRLADSVVENVEIKLIRASKYSIRHSTELEISKIRELASSIQQHGLLQPILVRPVEDELEVVAGHRRLQACKSLRWRTIPCIIKELNDKEAYEIQLVENIQRQTLDPIEEAEAFSKYVMEYGWGGVTELARRIGKSEEYVSHRIQLLRLPESIKQEINMGRLSVSHALELVNLSPSVQEKMVNAIIQNSLSVKAVRELKRLRSFEVEEGESYIKDKSTYINEKRIRILKKTIIALKLTLYRLDSLIEETKKTLEPNDAVTITNTLMYIRLTVHNLIDEAIKAKHHT